MPRSSNFIGEIVNGIHGTALKLSDQEINLHEFVERMHQDNIRCAERIIADGKVYHFASYGTNKNFWYSFDGTTGKYGDCNVIGRAYGE